MSTERDRAEAQEQLSIAERARAAARGPQPVPPFVAPLSGLLIAGGFLWLAAAMANPGMWGYTVAGFACLAGLLLVVALFFRAGGIVARPAGPAGPRVAWQLLDVAFAVIAGGVGAIFFGFPGWLVGFGVGLGVAGAVQFDRVCRGNR
ncbi:MAG TPA: hypothetical protein VF444_06210 [Pseudonocardiaceae bacterium]